MTRPSLRRSVAACIHVAAMAALVAISSADAVTIDMVTVGNAGNAPDTRYDFNLIGFGSVGYEYQIGKYEVTAGQYTEFLNAVAKADPKRLYNTSIGDPNNVFRTNIQRTGSSPNYNLVLPVGVFTFGKSELG